MNIRTYILGLGALSMVALSSCDTENVRSMYENSTAGITFLTAEQEESFPEKATELKFNVDVVRQNGQGDATVNLVSTYMKVNTSNKLEATEWNNNITVPPSITFKDGETMTSFQVSLSDNIEQGRNHYVNIDLDTKEAPLDANMSKLLTISRDFTYKSIGKKTLQSGWYHEGHEGGFVNKIVEMEQATQNEKRYRVVNVYKSNNTEDKDDYPMIITLSEKDNKKIAIVAETQVDKNLIVSSTEESKWDENKITLEMEFVDTKNKKTYSTTEVFIIQ